MAGVMGSPEHRQAGRPPAGPTTRPRVAPVWLPRPGLRSAPRARCEHCRRAVPVEVPRPRERPRAQTQSVFASTPTGSVLQAPCSASCSLYLCAWAWGDGDEACKLLCVPTLHLVAACHLSQPPSHLAIWQGPCGFRGPPQLRAPGGPAQHRLLSTPAPPTGLLGPRSDPKRTSGREPVVGAETPRACTGGPAWPCTCSGP